jgi:hypothetical protein
MALNARNNELSIVYLKEDGHLWHKIIAIAGGVNGATTDAPDR